MEPVWTHIETRCVYSGKRSNAVQFVENNKRLGVRPITTLSVTSNNALDLIRDTAENRDEWRTFIAEIRRGAAEAVRSDDP
ncbi:hypothetical protein ElyMa_005023600 [Elysia marginata]|uniref:PRELI/MSF1 domain-containing protein n=1 Tax=Elysia marginata TaxID=1093978 RepID=A0AAV4JAY6_9GAST|nr:hypothetical protein ElyMa_005023600 [Elysia marginata]